MPPFRYTNALADAIERRWQERWEREGTFVTPNPGEAGFDGSRPKFYCLDMFPYPSGAGLHVGHPEGYTATDIICRFRRMQGCNVLHPMGWDAFGLPAEQYAIQTGVHPAVTTKNAINTFRRQLKRFGFSYDWSREIATIDPAYYKWTQWIFLTCYDSWFDPEALSPGYPDGTRKRGAARPIRELLAQLESGDLRVDFAGGLVHIGVAANNPLSREPAGTRRWHELSEEERIAVIDGQRLAYLDEMTVNWCPALGTVLANDEVIDGKSERGGHPVLRKPLKQWQFRITAYAQRLLDDLALVNWPESTRTMQSEWIGRSEGAEIDFAVDLEEVKLATTGLEPNLSVFTTRPDTLFGATYMVVAPEHELVDAAIGLAEPGADVAALESYVRAARNKSDVDRMVETKDKTGVFTGVYAINPVNGARLPVWTADYVLMGYGSGAIMAVPAHDERDFAFATKFKLPIVEVVRPPAGVKVKEGDCFAGEGVAVNSASTALSINGLGTAEAKECVIKWLESTDRGSRRVNYRLRDWVFSRQRYWGEPIPIVYDERGRAYPVSAAALPLVLPELEDYSPVESETPQPLLEKATSWVKTTALEAGVDPNVLAPETVVTRETNTMPGSAGSSWYFLRYCDAKNSERFIGAEADAYWMGNGFAGVDLYVGGSEHAVGHLLYARFWQKVLFDLGLVSTPEPFNTLFHQGMITSYAYQRGDKSIVAMDAVREQGEGVFVESATGERVTPVVTKMSKRYKNVINPDDVIAEFGADTFRLYEMYMGPLDASKPWNTKDTVGCHRLLQRVWRLCVDEQTGALKVAGAADAGVERQLHRMIDKVAHDIPRLAFNTAISAIFEFVNAATQSAGLTREQMERFALVLAPFTPHVAEEIWSKLGHGKSLAYEAFPAADPAQLVDDSVEIPVSVNGKVRSKVVVPTKHQQSELEAAALADEKVRGMIEGKTVKKVIVVPGRMVNIVIS